MANAFKGEATAKAGGKTYTLRCDFNALCFFEEATGKEPLEVLENFEKGKVSVLNMRHLVHAFLQEHHEDATLKEAGIIISDDPAALERVVNNATPEAKAPKGGKRKAAKPA